MDHRHSLAEYRKCVLSAEQNMAADYCIVCSGRHMLRHFGLFESDMIVPGRTGASASDLQCSGIYVNAIQMPVRTN